MLQTDASDVCKEAVYVLSNATTHRVPAQIEALVAAGIVDALTAALTTRAAIADVAMEGLENVLEATAAEEGSGTYEAARQVLRDAGGGISRSPWPAPSPTNRSPWPASSLRCCGTRAG